MGQAYSVDLRERIIRYVEAGHSRRSAARQFGLSPSCVIRWLDDWTREGISTPKPDGGWRYSKLDGHRDFLIRRIEESPDISMAELCRELEDLGTRVHLSSVSRWFIRQGYTYKKNVVGDGTETIGRFKSA